MSDKVQVVPLFMGPENEINVFIRGYHPFPTEKSFLGIASEILRARPRGKVYLVDWMSRQRIDPTLLQLMNGAKVLGVIPAFAARVNPSTFAFATTALAAVQAYRHFMKHKNRAEKIGSNFQSYLRKQIPFATTMPMNLIGHSLGARIVHFALAGNDWSDFKIRDCVLLGSAADAYDQDWPECADEIMGKIYNIWSPSDICLKAFPDTVSKAGQCGIGWSYSKIVNKQVKGVSHWNYWTSLEKVLRKNWPGFKQSSIDWTEVFEDSTCPYCDGCLERFIENGLYECPYCCLSFEVSNGVKYTIDNTVPCGWCDEGYYSFAGNNPPRIGDYFTCPSCRNDTWLVDEKHSKSA